MPPKRMTANPIKAPRYRPGKVTQNNSDSDSDASDDDTQAEVAAPSKPPPKVTTAGGITSNLSKVDLNERRKVAAEKEAARIAEEKALKAKEEEGFVTASEDEDSEDGESGSGEEQSSEEEEESSEDEAPRRVMMRPTFIKKDKRKELGVKTADTRTEEELADDEEERRKKAADETVEEQIRRDIAAKAAGKRNWDDDEEEDEVDDTDDVDPEAELAAWKLRELKRINRDREAMLAREKEIEEAERRRNLTEDEKKREDDEFIARQQEEKDGKGKMGFMQKYYHKGAFYQEDAKDQGLDRRDIMGSKFADDVNRELLPQALQMRDMTKLGKKGATKYKDLKSEDTGRWGQFDDRRKGGPGSFNADERFQPDRFRDGDRGDRGASGANNMPIGERKKVTGAPEGPKAMRDRGERPRKRDTDSYRPGRERSRSRSISPRRDRDRDDRHRRKRSTSRDGDRYESDKRRRVDSR